MASKSFSCPVCGGDVPAKAKACPDCGACEKSGWNEEESAADALDLPGDHFDYDKFTEEEFGTPRKLRGRELFWRIIAGVVIVLMILTFAINFIMR